MTQESPGAKMKWFFRTWIGGVLMAVLIATSIKSAIADWNVVPTGSMKPTIVEGDRIFINKLAYDLKIPYTACSITVWDDPARGDIIVFNSPADGERLVKRVVGLPGDTIAMKNNVLYINGEPPDYQFQKKIMNQLVFKERFGSMNHPIQVTPDRRSMKSFGPLKVPEHAYFVMGDNRDNSADSRYFGFVKRGRIVGKATSVVISLDKKHYYKPRWERFFTDLP